MRKNRDETNRWRRWGIVTGILIIMATVIIPSYAIFAQADPSATVKDRLADRLSTILNRLDTELGALPGDKFPVLKDQLETISSLLDDIVSYLEEPNSAGSEGPTLKEKTIKLDLMLHRLVAILERIAATTDPDPTTPQRKIRETISDLRVWIKGYIAGVTADMGPLEARRYEEMARTLLTDVGKHLARIAERARPEEPSRIDLIIRHIRKQIHLLDRFIVRNFGPRSLIPDRP
jgi:hypothetical protein